MPIEKHIIKAHFDADHRALRAQDLTMSDAAAWAGLDKFKTRLELFAEKTGMIDPQGDNPAKLRGRAHEQAVAVYYRDRFPDTELIYPVNAYYRDTDCRLGATPDAEATIPGWPGTVNVQLKVIAKHIHQMEWSDGPPLRYAIQALGEAMLMDAVHAQLAVLVIDRFHDELHVYDIERNAAAEERIRDLARTFWADVAAEKQPVPDFARDGDTIAAMFPMSYAFGPPLDMSGDNALPVLLTRRERLKRVMKRAKERIDAMDTEIKSKMGDAEQATLPGWRLTWKTTHRQEVVIPAGSYRPLRVTARKERV